MLKPDIMPPRSKRFAFLETLLRLSGALALAMALLAPCALAQQQQERDPVPSPDDVTPGIPARPPRAGAPAGTAANVPSSGNVNSQPSNTVAVKPTAPPQVAQKRGDQFVFQANVNEVRLYATVVDQKQRLVTDLGRDDFTVFEDGQPQQITSFRREDVPVALGILIDNSGSMMEKREKVNDAAINLVKASNPQDQVFIVNFADEAYKDQDFTSSVDLLQEALEHIEARGGTALYDAVVGSAKYMIQSEPFLKKHSIVKKVLLVVTDGEDNASLSSLEEAIRYVQTENGPTIYTIGVLDKDAHEKRARRALEALAVQTGGVAFFPRDLNEVDAISKEVAKDIRNQYIIQYRSTKPQSEGGYRQVRVDANAPGYGRLQVRTRSGYYAGAEGTQRASSQQVPQAAGAQAPQQ